MTERPERGPGRRSRAFAAVATLAALPLTYAIVRAALVGHSPVAAIQLPPTDRSALLRAATLQAMMPDARIDASAEALAREVAATAPLASEPYFIMAKAAEQRGDLDRAIALMEVARRRRPNHPATRLQLVIYYGQARRFKDLFDEIDVAMRVNTNARRLLIPELSKLIADPEGRRAIADALARDPDWQREFFAAAQGRHVPADQSLALMNAIRTRRPAADLSLARQLYMDSLVHEGRASAARALWLETLPESRRERHALLYNGDFRAGAGVQPFGWTLHETEFGRAEIVRGERHLDVNYFGGGGAVLAEQLIALPPGRYRFSFAVRGEAGTSGANMFWTLRCTPEDREVARVAVGNVTGTFARQQSELTVPGACGGQRLRLEAEPGEVSSPIHYQFADIEVAR